MKWVKEFNIVICLVLFGSQLVACGGGSDSDDSDNGGDRTSNQANFRFNCDLNGLNGVLSMDVEAVGSSGVIWGGGPNPEITAVIGTGGVTYFTAGTMNSSSASYVFTGTNEFADFTDLSNSATFRVQWVSSANGLDMIVNPFGPGPTSHSCVLTDASYL